jgi:hypothetical protein
VLFGSFLLRAYQQEVEQNKDYHQWQQAEQAAARVSARLRPSV